MKQPLIRDDAVLCFGAFRLSRAKRELFHGDERVSLGARAFDLLAVLVNRAGALATKDELIAKVWQGSIVEENNLAVQIAGLRKVLAIDNTLAGCLQTVPRQGYRFLANVEVEPPDQPGGIGRPHAELSIVVFPFANLSGDVEHAYFAQGLRDAIAVGLSRIHGLTVYLPDLTPCEAGQRDRDVQADYALRGNLQRSGAGVRVTAQLIDRVDGPQIWSDMFDGVCGGSSDFQDEVTGRVAASVGRHVFATAARRGSSRNARDPASEALFRGIAADNVPQSLECLREQEMLFSQTIELAPNNGDAHARLARAILLQAMQGHAPARRRGEALKRGTEFAQKALILDPHNARAHLAASYQHMLGGDFERCARSSERALVLDRSFAMAHNMHATALAHLGHCDQAVRQAEMAIRLDLAGPQFDVFMTTLGLSRLLAGDVEGAVGCFTRARVANPRLPRAHAWAAIALAIKGETTRAKKAVADLLQVAPSYRLALSVDGCCQLSTVEYRQLYRTVVEPGAMAAGVPV